MSSFLTGIQYFFAAVFVVTGLTKLRDLTAFEVVLIQLFGSRPFRITRLSSRVGALGVALYELVLGGLLAFGLWPLPTTALLVVTTVVFTVVVGRAWRMHVDCGCLPGRRANEVASFARSVLLTALAATLLLGGVPGGFDPVAPVWSAGVAGLVVLTTNVVARLTGRRHPPDDPPPHVQLEVARSILAEHGRELRAHTLPAEAVIGPSVELGALCRATRLPVSALFIALEDRRTPPRPSSLLPVGARPHPFTTTAETGETVTSTAITLPALVTLFSAECKRCRSHLPGFVDHLAEGTFPKERVIVVVAGDPEDALPFRTALAGLATVVLEPYGGPVSTAFSARDLPAVYLLGGDGVVLSAAETVHDLVGPAA